MSRRWLRLEPKVIAVSECGYGEDGREDGAANRDRARTSTRFERLAHAERRGKWQPGAMQTADDPRPARTRASAGGPRETGGPPRRFRAHGDHERGQHDPPDREQEHVDVEARRRLREHAPDRAATGATGARRRRSRPGRRPPRWQWCGASPSPTAPVGSCPAAQCAGSPLIRGTTDGSMPGRSRAAPPRRSVRRGDTARQPADAAPAQRSRHGRAV